MRRLLNDEWEFARLAPGASPDGACWQPVDLPHDFLIDARINLAAFYLKSTDEPIKNIASACGFSNASTFCTTFRNRMGLTPSRYRMNRQAP